jgi:hypothetical protein
MIITTPAMQYNPQPSATCIQDYDILGTGRNSSPPGEITHGILILLNGDAQKIKVITGGEVTCPQFYTDFLIYKLMLNDYRENNCCIRFLNGRD